MSGYNKNNKNNTKSKNKKQLNNISSTILSKLPKSITTSTVASTMATPLNQQQQLIMSYPTPNTSTPMATNTVVKHKKINNEKISQLTKRVIHLEDTLRETVPKYHGSEYQWFTEKRTQHSEPVFQIIMSCNIRYVSQHCLISWAMCPITDSTFNIHISGKYDLIGIRIDWIMNSNIFCEGLFSWNLPS